MILLFAAPLARAIAAPSECAPREIFATLPAAGETAVPVDARLVALVTPGCEPSGWTVSVSTDEGEIAAGELSSEPYGGWVETFDPGELAPETTYTVLLTPDDDGEATELSFTTGGSLAAGASGAPVVTAISAHGDEDQGVVAGVEVSPADDPDALSFLLLLDTDAQVLDADVAGPLEGRLTNSAVTEACVTVLQVDNLGEEHPSDVACAEVTECGCATPTPPSALLALAPLLLVLRRRP